MQKAVIIGAARTPIGSFMGTLSQKSALDLGAVAIKAAITRAHISSEDIDEVIMGQVLQAGVGQAPARQAALLADIPNSVPCMTINKVCGSGLKALMLGCQAIALGDAKIIVAGGMESMSNAPYALPKARAGLRMGDSSVVDLMLKDGLWDPYGNMHMGSYGDLCARNFNFTRQEQDSFAVNSYEKALLAQRMGYFDSEIEGVKIKTKNGEEIINKDEDLSKYQPEKIANLKPSFALAGTVTAANASKISDGAAALILSSEEEALRRKLKIKAYVRAQACHAHEPENFTTAPAEAIKLVLKKAGLSIKDIDAFEINEAFSVVAMHSVRELGLDINKVNIFGGAVALGHPIGCSGARVVVTLLNILEQKNLKLGLASLCLGGGEAVAVILERAGS